MDNNKKDILDSLKKSGTGFKHPKGYFDEVEEKLASALSQNDEFEMGSETGKERTDSVKPKKLDLIGKNHGFAVPENYFEEDPGIKKEAGSAKIISMARKNAGRWLSLAVAASFLLFFGTRFFTVNDKQLDLSEINENEIENWIDADLVSFNAYEIAEAYSDVDLENEMFSDEEVADYLNTIDIEQLILDN